MIKNILTVDLEDWYQAIETIPYRDWPKYESRVVKNTEHLLRLLEANRAKATFFILGYEAENHPALIKRIFENGHEIATHGYSHRFIYTLDKDTFRKETRRSIDILESITGQKVLGHRAPAWSITRKSLWALDILSEEGLCYDSSVSPYTSYLYGIKGTPNFPYRIKEVFALPKNDLYEFPVVTQKIMGKEVPVAGGFFTRLWPLWMIRACMRKVNLKGLPAMIWVHPWELDVFQPRLKLPLALKRHYYNLGSTEKKLRSLLKDFAFSPIKEILHENTFYPSSGLH